MGGKQKKVKIQKSADGAAAAAADAPSTTGRNYTLSIAVPGSILENCASVEAAAVVAGQIARAACIFSVDEIVVYDDSATGSSTTNDGTVTAATAALARLLQYIETPPWLRTPLMPSASAYGELKAAETLCPALQSPHHTRGGSEWRPYQEGVVMRSEPGMGSFVDIGSDRNAHVEVELPVGRRITVHLGNTGPTTAFVPAFSETMLHARVVPPSEPRTSLGLHWGFSVRVARGLSRVLKDSPWKGGYDLTVGTSPLGVARDVAELVLPRFKHACVLFGGLEGLEEIAAEDEALAQAGKTAADCVSLYLNCVPGQGCSTIRTEDAVLVCCSYLHASLQKYGL